MDIIKLQEHAELTIRLLEMYAKRRNYRGLKDWERKLLYSAYNSLGLVIPNDYKLKRKDVY